MHSSIRIPPWLFFQIFSCLRHNCCRGDVQVCVVEKLLLLRQLRPGQKSAAGNPRPNVYAVSSVRESLMLCTVMLLADALRLPQLQASQVADGCTYVVVGLIYVEG